MPVVLSYPGVYVEEVPSGQFTITGVATSITAFVGRAPCGPTDEPVYLFNFGDYERIFGGLAYDFPLSYAVQDFFTNGGGQAVVARLFEKNTDLSASDWDKSAANALAAMQSALKGKPEPAVFNRDDLLGAGADAAAALPQPDQPLARAMLQKVTVAAPTTAADFATAVAALTAPPYPAVTAAMALDSNGGGALAAPAVQVTNAVLAAAFDPTGNTFNKTSTVADLQSAAAMAAIDFQENPSMKIARAAQKAVTGASVSAALDASISAIGPSIPAGTGNAAPAGIEVLQAVMAVIRKAFDPLVPPATLPVPGQTGHTGQTDQTPAPEHVDKGDTTPTPTALTMATSIKTAIGAAALTGSALIAGNAAVDAAAAASTGAKASVVSVIQAALLAASNAAFSLPAEQVLNLVAANPGAWGNNFMATIDVDNITAQSAKIFANSHLRQEDLFNLTVFYRRHNGTTDVERFTNVTVKQLPDEREPLPNRIDLELAAKSQYVRVANDDQGLPTLPANAPVLAAGSAAGGNDGQYLQTSSYVGDQSQATGIYMLKKIDLFNLLCIPPDNRVTGRDTDPEVYQEAMAYCVDRRAVLIVDPPTAWADKYTKGELDAVTPESLHLYGTQTRNAAVYFPRVIKEDLMMDGRLDVFPACGAIAGVIAASDVQRGVWKAPAGQNAGLNNIYGLELSLTDDEQGELNPRGINCLRNLPVLGPVVWGARTLRGADQLSDDFKYLSVRRLALFLEESLYRGTRWAVFEPNNEALWSSLRLAINAFMGDLGKQGAFYDFKITCDKDTNSQTNIDKGIVTVLIQYAPVKPAEFVVLQFQQQAGLSPS